MRHHIKRITVQAVGILLIVLGIAGLALPFLQGILLIITGLLLLSLYSPRLKEIAHRLASGHPRAGHYLHKVERFLERVLGA